VSSVNPEYWAAQLPRKLPKEPNHCKVMNAETSRLAWRKPRA